jgi:uncharacterized membrane protein YkvA (DUF1232 family)
MNERSEVEQQLLELLPTWLRGLPDDARALLGVVLDEALPEATRRSAVTALNYLFKSLDLIPDGIEDLGFIDDAFVIRVAAAQALAADTDTDGEREPLARLASECGLVREFLGEAFELLEGYVTKQGDLTVRGRNAAAILHDDETRGAFASDVRGFADAYITPSFARDPKNLVKLKAFLTTKLEAQ